MRECKKKKEKRKCVGNSGNTIMSSMRQTMKREGQKSALLSVCTRSFLWMDEVMSDVTVPESNAPQKVERMTTCIFSYPGGWVGLTHCPFAWEHCLSYYQIAWNKENILSTQKGCYSHDSSQSASLEFSGSCPCSQRTRSECQTSAGFSLTVPIGQMQSLPECSKGNPKYINRLPRPLTWSVLFHLAGLISSDTTEDCLQTLLPLVLMT